jgi:hypothetical protein
MVNVPEQESYLGHLSISLDPAGTLILDLYVIEAFPSFRLEVGIALGLGCTDLSISLSSCWRLRL